MQYWHQMVEYLINVWGPKGNAKWHNSEIIILMTAKISWNHNLDNDKCFFFFHSYVQGEKPFCRPPKETVKITEIEAKIPLKPLSIHTVNRILKIPRVIHEISKAKEESGDEIVKVLLKQKIGNDT